MPSEVDQILKKVRRTLSLRRKALRKAFFAYEAEPLLHRAHELQRAVLALRDDDELFADLAAGRVSWWRVKAALRQRFLGGPSTRMDCTGCEGAQLLCFAKNFTTC
jgi:hypothetical protein